MTAHHQSLIYIGEKSSLDKFIQEKFSLTLSNPTNVYITQRPEGKKSVGIEEVKAISEFAKLKGYNELTKIIIIDEGELLTTEAQNSLLKTLEEPPEYTQIIIRCNFYPDILPTIKSRCILINHSLNSKIEQINRPDDKKNFTDLEFYEQLIYINHIASIKDSANKNIEIENLFIQITENLLRQIESNIGNHGTILRLTEKLTKVKDIRQKIKQNVNIKLSLDNLAILLSK